MAQLLSPLVSRIPPLRVDLPRMHAALRQRLAQRFDTPDTPAKAVLLFQGGEEDLRHNTDNEKLFRQESNFHYLFGVNEAGFYGAINARDGHSVLFMPRLPAEYAVWMGKIRSTDEVRALYGVDRVCYVDEIHKYFTDLDPDVIYTLRGKNTDSGSIMPPAHFDGMDTFRVDHGRLWAEVCECRVFKTEDEIEVMRYVNKISSFAHLEVMKAARAGMYEYELESLFYHLCYSLYGCRYFAYIPICASGPNSATLHYGHSGCPNNRVIEDGDMVLLDMGVEYHCYASDITRSFPVSGKFTQAQRDVWETVKGAQDACFAAIKPGVKWDDIHRTAERVIVTSLAARGYLRGDVEAMLADNVAALFMPHGVGHLLGIDTHDIGGYPRGTSRIQRPGLNKLRTTRVLQPGMVLTVEPGCYFIESLLLPAFADPTFASYLVEEKIRGLLSFGGVRIEDNIVIREGGFENLSSGPQNVEEVEASMAK